MNIIFCPNAKYFALPVIMIYEHYSALQEESLIVANAELLSSIKSYGNFYSQDISSFDFNIIDSSSNLIFFCHNTNTNKEFFRKTITEAQKNSHQFKVSYMPDGLGNSMLGGDYIGDAKEYSTASIELRDVFSFGFIHYSTASQHPKEKIVCLSYKLFEKYLDQRYFENLFEPILNSMNSYAAIIFIPYRPWCTKKFHGGVYDFGSTKELSEIYTELITEISIRYRLNNYLVLYRGDSRFAQESLETYNQIQAPNKIRLDPLIPKDITLEPFIYKSIKKIKSNFHFITLDSTTFQCIPFMNFSAENKLISCDFGCPQKILFNKNGGQDFHNRKLKGKIKDFSDRYSSFKQAGLISNIENIEEGYFYAEL